MNTNEIKNTYNLLSKVQNKKLKFAQVQTPSGRESGIGPGRTLMQPEKTWDEVAMADSGLRSWAKRKGIDLNDISLERKNKKIYANGVEMTSASIKTDHYADNAPTRAQIEAQKEKAAPTPAIKEQPSTGAGAGAGA